MFSILPITMVRKTTIASLFLLFVFLYPITNTGLKSQTTVQIGTGTEVPANTLYSPLYRFSGTSTTTGSRANILFTAAEMANAGVPAGATIIAVEFNKTNVANFNTPCTYKMYMANTNNTSLSTSLTWASVLTTHTEVFSNTSFNIPSAAGWVTWIVTPFTYTGGAFEIANECVMGGNGAATDAFRWQYTASTSTDRIVGVASATGATLNGSVAAYKFRPNIRIVYTLASACSSPPVAGTALTSKSSACNGENFNLTLSGNSIGSGQTYQWQSSATGTAPWSDIPSSNFTNITVSQTTTTWYRCAVTCNSITSYSDSVQVVTPSGVSGTYTINNALPTGSGNFASFSDAIAFIGCGIAGPVTFNVAPGSGPYTEQVILPALGGTSSTNKITINGNGATLQFLSTNTNERAVIKLNGTDHVVLDSLRIVATGTSTTEFGYGIQLLNDADSNIIRKCTIEINTSSTSTANYAGILINSSATPTNVVTTVGASACDGNHIENNIITGGYAGIAIIANTNTNTVNGNIVRNNLVRDFHEYGIVMNGNVNGLIEGNEVHRMSRTTLTTFRGISLQSINQRTHISKNKIHSPYAAATTNTNAAFGIFINACRTTVGNENIVSNNMIYNFVNGSSGNPNHNGALVTSSDNIKFYYNSILLDDAGSTCTTCGTRGFYMQTAPFAGLEFRNNNVVISRGGTGPKQSIYFEGTGISFISNNNNFYIASSGGTIQTGFANGTGYSTLIDWQTGTSQDLNSLSVDPLFVSSTDLHLQVNSPLDDAGTAISTVTTDIDNETRGLSITDIGADELPPTIGIDMRPEALISPAFSPNGCYNTETIIVSIRNNSTDPIDFSLKPVTVSVNVTGAATGTYTTIINTGTLAAGASQNVTMATPGSTINMSVPGGYNFDISTTVSGDVNTANDIINVIREKQTLLPPTTVTASPNNYCAVGGTPTLTAIGATGFSNLNWQSSLTSLTGFTNIAGATTTNYTLTTAISQTTYFRLVVTCGSNTEVSSEVSVTIQNPQILSTNPASRCGPGSVSLSATANPGATINWYATATGSSPLASGDVFNTPSITNTTTYYVAASDGGTTMQVGKTTHGTLLNLSAVPRGIQFNANNAFVINSVKVFSTSANAGAGIITLYDAANNVVGSPVNVSWSGGGTTTAPVANILSLNISVPVGNNYKLMMTTFSSGGIGYESSGMSAAAYAALSNADITFNGSMTSLTALSTTTYYYFYDWEISTGCEGTRTPVVATINSSPAITANATQSVLCSGGNTTLNVSSSNSNYVYNWLPFNIPGNSLNVSPTETTKYYVEASDAVSGCTALDSVTIFVQPTITGVTATPPAFCITGGTSQLSITPSTGYASGSLQWQSSSNNVTFNNISGANSATYTTPTITSTTYYKIQAKDEVGAVCSEQSVTVEYNNPQITSTTPNYRCGAGSVVLGATASGSATVNWYENATGGTSIAIGNSFTTPVLSSTTTYYVSASEGSGGSINVASPSIGTSTFITTTAGWGLRFTVNNPLTINTVTIRASATTAGTATIQIKVTDLSDVVLFSGTSHSFSITTSLADYLIPVNIAVPIGNYKMVMTYSGINNMVRESTGVSFPYNSPGNEVSITAGANGSGTAQTTSAYYWFYNWVISKGCESGRTAITATIDNDPGCVPVPVSLVQFKGSKQGNFHRLEWVTVNEVNSKGFHVQRSSNGVSFSTIGFIASQNGGNSISQQSYQFIDEQPLRGNNYYRLQQVDRDGSISVSNVVLLRSEEVREIQLVGVYPNPTKGEVTVQIQSPKAERVSVVLMDISGKQVVQQNHMLVQGSNQLRLDMSRVAQGSYLIKVICANGCQTTATKVVKE
jgi:hypothetical protein